MPGKTAGIWIGEDEDLIERFDEELGTKEPTYSRSESIKDSMEFYLHIQDALDDMDLTFPSERDKRMWIRQAIFDRARSEAQPE